MTNDLEHLKKVWRNIRKKCNDISDITYGGKGIIVCEEWDDFNNFKEWSLNNGYQEDLVLSRKERNLDYDPNNCEWITDFQHRQKRRREIYITYNGETMSLRKVSELVGIAYATLKFRYLAGNRDEILLRKAKYKKSA